jgi:hypothetical protein
MKPISVMVYGRPGAGKTLLLQKMATVLGGSAEMLNFEGDPSVEPDVIQTVSKATTRVRELLAKPPDTIILDSITELVEIFMRNMLGLEGGGAYKEPKDMRQVYQAVGIRVGALLAPLKHSKANLLATCTEKQEEDDTGSVKAIFPGIFRSVRDRTEYLFNEVWHLEHKPGPSGPKTRLLTTSPTRKIFAKTRADLPETVENPKPLELIEHIRKGRTLS